MQKLVKLCRYGWFRSVAVPLQTDMVYICSLALQVLFCEKIVAILRYVGSLLQQSESSVATCARFAPFGWVLFVLSHGGIIVIPSRNNSIWKFFLLN
jgi:hypothetical protein